ncbi:MAG: flagellar filament capping protein FliD [Candidatus Hydrogenedentes bacterium]|nr:flagellar filament capping protein FliD [Candidatus Hydrogenedentota bacterium]
MGGVFNVGGLITGLDTNNIIAQLMLLERQPITRLQARITALEAQRQAVLDLRTTLTTLRSRSQDFQFNGIFSQFLATSSSETVLTSEVTGTSPVAGSYTINVTQLASATVATSSAVLGDAINKNVSLDTSGITTPITAGQFTINGVAFTVDPASDSLQDIINDINSSAAGVTASYSASTDKVTIRNSTPNDTSLINFGGTGDTSNFLAVIAVADATQTTVSGETEVVSTRHLGAVDPSDVLNTVDFDAGTVTSGTFQINGITITIDVTVDSISDVLARINDSDAKVTATYDSSNDTIRVVSDVLGSRTIDFTSGTSNFLSRTNLTTATQTAGNDAQFTVNGGATQTRNTNDVTDAISGVTLSFLSTGTSSVTVSTDDDSIVEDVQEFVTAFNEAVRSLVELTAREGRLAGDASIRMIENYLRDNIFSQISGVSGDFKSLVDIGITTGDTFDSTAIAQLQLDEDAFRDALADDRLNVESLFTNTGGTGIADLFDDYLDDVASTTGFLNERSRTNGTIDEQIDAYNQRIEQLEDRLETHERRLRAQFTRLEQLSAGFQSQNTALASLAQVFLRF